MIMAIDPGNRESAFAWIDADDMRPIKAGKIENADMYAEIARFADFRYSPIHKTIVLERISSYGMTVGRDVFETAEWYGRFWREVEISSMNPKYMYRRDVKALICGTPSAKDSNIRRALIDRFAKHDLKNGKGTKKNPDWFYGFFADMWQAYALGVAWLDRRMELSNEQNRIIQR